MAANVPQFKLNNGVLMPSVGLGCWMGSPGGGEKVYKMVTAALKAGYRHFDTADGYGNEEEVGRAIRDSGIPRTEIFATTKLNNTDHHRVKEAFDRSLKALNIEYIDLWLMHWPQGKQEDGVYRKPHQSPTYHDTWADMVKIYEDTDKGKVRAIGVSNFGVPILKSLLDTTNVVPAAVQVELHPCLPSCNLRKFCADKSIIITAYSPIGQPTPDRPSPLLTEESIREIAKKHGVSEGQVVLSWGVQHGIVVVPKSENPDRIKANISLVKLDDADMKTIDSIHKKPGLHRSLLGYHQPDGSVFGWTYEEMGWELVAGGHAKA
ncbi:aldo/keto reductase [Diaporthe helianthi]|uniref:Aldo/keto reductase n=1 Tax=Diaporthe helianthi TaxID=158607 RepID=A0A2P5I562_DIAHE|nr:aldo/keto reductase [Diaporthe helianthi]